MRKKRVDQIPWQGFYWSAWVRWVPLSREKCFTGKFRLSSLALKLFSNGCGMLLPWMAIWIHRFSSCKGTSVHCHFYSIWSGTYLYLIVFFPPPINSRLQVSLLLLGFASACAPLFRHDLALQGNSSVNLFSLPSCWGFVYLSNFATGFYYFCLLLLSKQPQKNFAHPLLYLARSPWHSFKLGGPSVSGWPPAWQMITMHNDSPHQISRTPL